jgi:hypothetical protein
MRESNVIIIRFMGTTKYSSDISSVFESIQKQLETIFNIKQDDDGYAEIESFENKLFYISENHLSNDKKLIILLDSIDQLSKEDYDLKWLFIRLPKYIKIIFSVIPNYENILDNLKQEIDDENILELKILEVKEAKDILSNYLKLENRKLSIEQRNSVDKMIDEMVDINPLQIRLIFDVVSKWPSFYNIPEEFIKCTTSIQIIKYLFKNIEKNVFDNEILFKHCLFYLTLFEYRGITENELEDILSIDDEVLDSIFVHHHPPVRRFQIGLFSRFKYELKEYITNKTSDDQCVIAW